MNRNWPKEWNAAQEHYNSAEYRTALNTYLSSPPSADTDPALIAAYYYNLGTTYLRLSEAGLARAHLEVASALRPFDSDIRHNRDLAVRDLESLLGSEALSPATTSVEWALDRASFADGIPLTATIVAVSLVAGVLSARKRLIAKSRRTLFGLFLALGIAFLGVKLGYSRPKAYVIKDVQIRSGPGDHFLEVGSAQKGMEFRLEGREEKGGEGNPGSTWTLISYGPGKLGWLRSTHLLWR